MEIKEYFGGLIKTNPKERFMMVKAMEFICRQINNEDVLMGWFMGGVADGDIDYWQEKVSDEDLEIYCEDDDDFKELMRCFLRRMASAYKSGGLFCNGVCSGDKEDDK